MTGEMSWIKPNGEDASGAVWDVHAFVARSMRSRLRPYDVYAGPYIDHKRGKIFLGEDDHGLGVACLWVHGIPPAYREPVVVNYFPAGDREMALEAARKAVSRRRAP